MLVDGQGNFGSVDGDPPAAMRYTEARLTEPALDILQQLDMETVKFVDNFDGTLMEPEVLPSALPNLLINGASGIVVGMATNIPPHNLSEITDAICMMLENWEKLEDITVEDLMRFVKGPDFPTAGLIIQDETSDPLAQIYGSGNGRVIMRARVRIEEMTRGRNRLIVTELPYMVNKASLIERIAELTRDGALEGIADLRDESDRQGMRIVIELSKTADTEKILSNLFKKTPMQSTFGINLLALVDGSPHRLTLKQALRVYAEHRLEVIRKRSEYELKKNEERLHILEALRIALQNLDEVIDIIRHSQRVETARENLKSRFKLDDVQANAILDMPLRRLASLERKKIEIEYKEVSDRIKELKSLLRSPKLMRQVAITELKTVKAKYADPRRTQIIYLGKGEKASELLTQTDVMPQEEFWVAISEDYRISRTSDDKPYRMGGSKTPWNLIRTNSHQTIFLVTSEGKAAAIHSLSIPVQESIEEGIPVHKISPLSESDTLVDMFAVPIDKVELKERYIFSISRLGMVKRSVVEELPGASAVPFTLVKVNEDDELFSLFLTNGKEQILISTAAGMSIRFDENDVRVMGLVAAGVNGIKLKEDDFIIGAGVLKERDNITLLTKNGQAKRIEAKDYPLQGRYGQGVISWKLAAGDQLVVQMIGKLTDKGIVHFRKAASRLFKLGDAPKRTRMANGAKTVEVKAKDEIIYCTIIEDFTSYWDNN